MAMQSNREGAAGLKQRLEQILGLGSPRSGSTGQGRSVEEDGGEGSGDNSRFFTEDVMKVCRLAHGAAGLLLINKIPTN